MDTEELQKRCVEFAAEFNKRTNRKVDKDSALMHLMEEVGEVAAEVFSEKSGRSKLDKEHLGGELADVFIVLSEIGNFYGIDIEDAVLDKIKKDTTRM